MTNIYLFPNVRIHRLLKKVSFSHHCFRILICLIYLEKMTTRSRVSTQVNYPISMSDPRTQFLIEYDNNLDNTDEDNSF